MMKKVKRLKDNEREKKKLQKTISNLTYNAKRCAKLDGNRLYNAPTNIVTLITIIRVALLLLGDDILLDDILWYGKLSVI